MADKKIIGRMAERKVYIQDDQGKLTELSIGPSQKLFNHSEEFCWGYAGSGPAQLALALLLRYTKDEKFAVNYHQEFKFDVIASLPQKDFELDPERIKSWISERKT